jgi:hypothetical protein
VRALRRKGPVTSRADSFSWTASRSGWANDGIVRPILSRLPAIPRSVWSVGMTEIDRRQLVGSLAASAAWAGVSVRTALAQPGNVPGEAVRRLLAASADRIDDIGPGWLPIIADALGKMLAIDPELEVRQIKQKLGGLRIYYRSGYWEELQAIVGQAERLCATTCEICGRRGSPCSPNGWIRTLCDAHRV